MPLLWRRRAPFGVMVAVGLAATLVSLYQRPGQNLQYGGLVAFYTVASLGRRRWQRLGVLVVIVVTFPPASLLLKHNDLSEFMFTFLLPLAAFLVGSLERSHREHAQTLRERADQLERERIAEAGRDAMVQLRWMLGVLKADEGQRLPQPTLAQLPELVSGTAELEVTGEPRPVPPDTEIAVYRIVQEALTNTVKHAAARHGAVLLDWSSDQLHITVTDDGQGNAPGTAGGHGLIGIRERAAVWRYGGGRPTPGRRLRGAGQIALQRRRSMIRVVLADDQELVRSGFAMIRDAQPDIEVVGEAGDGAEAVEVVRDQRPDVALLDVRMPARADSC